MRSDAVGVGEWEIARVPSAPCGIYSHKSFDTQAPPTVRDRFDRNRVDFLPSRLDGTVRRRIAPVAKRFVARPGAASPPSVDGSTTPSSRPRTMTQTGISYAGGVGSSATLAHAQSPTNERLGGSVNKSVYRRIETRPSYLRTDAWRWDRSYDFGHLEKKLGNSTPQPPSIFIP